MDIEFALSLSENSYLCIPECLFISNLRDKNSLDPNLFLKIVFTWFVSNPVGLFA